MFVFLVLSLSFLLSPVLVNRKQFSTQVDNKDLFYFILFYSISDIAIVRHCTLNAKLVANDSGQSANHEAADQDVK